MTPREHFEKEGRMYPPKGRSRGWSIGRLTLRWQWGDECWCELSDKGWLAHHFVALGTVEDTGGTKGLRLCLWRLIVMAGLRRTAGVGGNDHQPNGHQPPMPSPLGEG